MGGDIAVLIESGARRTFASALDWPGWSRSGRTEESALESLASYADRYAPVATAAGVGWPAVGELVVMERSRGTPTTDFGAPDVVATCEVDPMPGDLAVRAAALVRSAWEYFDHVAATSPEELAKGPRGGGRDRSTMVDHVLGAEAAYARKMGLQVRQPEVGDAAAVEAVRRAVEERIVAGSALPRSRGAATWPVSYAARRIAWHVLDHAWEMEDRRA
jgi:hypothetical protein